MIGFVSAFVGSQGIYMGPLFSFHTLLLAQGSVVSPTTAVGITALAC